MDDWLALCYDWVDGSYYFCNNRSSCMWLETYLNIPFAEWDAWYFFDHSWERYVPLPLRAVDWKMLSAHIVPNCDQKSTLLPASFLRVDGSYPYTTRARGVPTRSIYVRDLF
jgi:hypothetical protein